MKNKIKLDSKKLTFIALVCLFATVLIVASLYIFNQFNSKSDKNDYGKDADISDVGNQTKPDITENKDALQVDLVEYTVYNLADVDFQFVIARMRVKADSAINVDLSNFKTSESIALNDVDSYVKKLEEKALFLGKQNVWFEIVSKESSIISNIFIPVKDKKASEVKLTVDFGESKEFTFNLKSAKGTTEMLSYKSDDVITDGKSYQMRVSNTYRIDGEKITRSYASGYSEEYLYPSTAQIHAFNVEAVSLWGEELVIEKAYYTVNSTGETFEAFNEQFSTTKYENLLNKPITDKSSGVVFFETLNPTENPITYKGVLKLKVKGQENYIIINVDL